MMPGKPKYSDKLLADHLKSHPSKKTTKPSNRKPALLPDGTIGEQYAFIRYEMAYDTEYDRGMNNEQGKLEKLLDEFVLNYKPKAYRIINAQIVYLGVDGLNNLSGAILHVVHIGYNF